MDFETLAQEVNGRLVNERFGPAVFEGVSIDSRSIKETELFIAIRGENEDGHNYIRDALDRRCAGLLVASDYSNISAMEDNVPIVVVKDTHQSMIGLATAYRRKVNAKLIAVTGSNGKTTTKDLIYAMTRRTKNKAYCSPGNLNNLYGLPLAIFGMPSDSRYGVLELGISVPGEMARLAEIAQPEIVLITNVGPTHLETLGSVEGVAEAKFELVDSVGPDRPVIINADDPVLVKTAARRNREVVTFGIKNRADFMAQKLGVSQEGFPLIKIDDSTVTIRLFGEHQIYNLLAAYAVCKVAGLDVRADDLNGIDYRFALYRGEIEHVEGMTIIADCYNANPVSMESGLKSLHNYLKSPGVSNRRSVVVIGDMLELGERSRQFHRDVGVLLAQLDFELVLSVGPLSADIKTAAVDAGLDEYRIRHYNSTEEAGEALIDDVRRGDIVYFKASRGIGLEKILTLLKGTAFRQN